MPGALSALRVCLLKTNCPLHTAQYQTSVHFKEYFWHWAYSRTVYRHLTHVDL